MRWRFFIPHHWEHDCAVWEDVYLLPDVKAWKGESIWLTVDSLGVCENDEERDKALNDLDGREFTLDRTNMLVAAEDFSKDELIEWVKKWLIANSLPVTELAESSRNEFKNTNQHARIVAKLKALLEKTDDKTAD